MPTPTLGSPLTRMRVPVRYDMALEVPQRIHERLVSVIDDLRNAVGQEAARSFVIFITSSEPVELEPEDANCDDSSIDFINDNWMIDDCEIPSNTPVLASSNIEGPPLRTRGPHTIADRTSLAISPHAANAVPPNTISTSGPDNNWRGS